MGVIKRVPRSAIDASICEDEAIGEIMMSFQQDPEVEDEPVVESRRQQNYRQRSLRTRLPAIPADTVPRRNNAQGSRRSRRYENTLILLRQAGHDEVEHDEVTIEDLVPAVQSPRTFSRFLCEGSMMGLWHTFLECGDDTLGQVGQSGITKNQKLRTKSADPEEAFHGICRKLRNILKQRHLPLGIIDNLEEQVLHFFANHPLNSTYECGPLDAYRRGLLHAISQYNNLKSFSIGKKKTEKIVHVQNKQPDFVPPSLRLVSYIETRVQASHP